MPVRIIAGKGFGDEGKGLVTDYFAAHAGGSVICVRHNGGAQAGHTVDLPDKRFVFSQLSSGSFRGAPTCWADSFLPDLYKLGDEAERFKAVGGAVPDIYAHEKCRCTCIIDVLINMILETGRGEARHGSCGMGINEAVVRSSAFPLYLGDIMRGGAESLFRRLREIQRDHLPIRLSELSIDPDKAGEYGEMLKSRDVLYNAAETMMKNTQNVTLTDPAALKSYDEIIFEGAQGLLLDENNLSFAPHLTSSRTGICEPARILRELYGADDTMPETEIVYVTRTYVTRHGAGRLPHEGLLDPEEYGINDRTNIKNEWQGALRFAPHGSPEEFTAPVRNDLSGGGLTADVSLFITHLNETGGNILTAGGAVPAGEYCKAPDISGLFGRFYFSASPFSGEAVSL